MAYMNDPRENRFGPNGQVWENDNRVEERFYWNGAFVDLCDLPPADYAKTIFHTEGSGGDTPKPPVPPVPGKTKNKITVNLKCDASNAVYTVRSEKEVASEVTVTLGLRGSEGLTEDKIVILNGEKETVKTIGYTGMQPRIEKITISPSSDDKFEYTCEQPVILPYAYSLQATNIDLAGMNPQEIIDMARSKEPVDMVDEKKTVEFTVKPVIVDPSLIKQGDMKAIDDYSTVYTIITDREIADICENTENFSVIDLCQSEKVVDEKTGQNLYIWKKYAEKGTGAQLATSEEEAEANKVNFIVKYK